MRHLLTSQADYKVTKELQDITCRQIFKFSHLVDDFESITLFAAKLGLASPETNWLASSDFWQ
ncbi:uncharacterized protein RCO7_14244 [Rhynchosporium graminicola]|uniref:Uncharacterized protein n=1 Tax=Rhynchosporium graminicola TaxID=2792576 RepID=A0A1E1K2M7_9HELO|nr:uncharacterized protein RCO7_14244 [Rhynchosporium commune]